MHRTKNDLPEKIRITLVDLLNTRLADSTDLMHQAKQAHWNIKGPSFIAPAQHDHVEALSSALAAYGKAVRHAIDQSDEPGDKDAADIFTEISRGVDKYLWFVESHLG